MTPERLAEIDARCKKATPGEWAEYLPDAYGDYRIVVISNGVSRSLLTMNKRSDRQDVKDLAFIAHARTDLPEAIAEIKRLQKRVEELEGGKG